MWLMRTSATSGSPPRPTVRVVLHYVSGPSTAGPDAYPVSRPQRGVVDELVWQSLCFATPAGYRPLFLDLHVPRPTRDDQTACPLVIWVHGGGWESGSRRRLPVSFDEHWFVQRVLLAGFAVAAVDYRLCAEAGFPAPVDDIRSAMAWLAAHADDFGYDATRLVLWGESAGAHLALLATAAGGTPHVAAVVDWYGPTDLAALAAGAPTVAAGGEPALSPGMQQVMHDGGWGVDAASPVRVLGPATPPVFIAHGRDDSMVPLSQSEALREHLTGLGVTVEFHETPGGHVFEDSDVLPDVISWSLEFLGRHLGFDLGPHPDPDLAVPAERGASEGASAAGASAAGASAGSGTWALTPVEDISVAGADGRAVPVRIHRPVAGSDTVVVYLDDGPGSSGRDPHQDVAARLSASVPATVVHVDCRRGPERHERHPPAALDDCVRAVTWAHEHLGRLGGSRLVLAGDGAGGGLAVAAALHCRDHGLPLAALFVNYPVLDRTAGPSPDLRESTSLPGTADLTGLCPVIVGVGAHDPLFEDVLRFAHRLRLTGVPTRFRVFPTLGHAYCESAPLSAAATRATEQLHRDLGQLLGDGTLA